jgi:hypothetical protein
MTLDGGERNACREHRAATFLLPFLLPFVSLPRVEFATSLPMNLFTTQPTSGNGGMLIYVRLFPSSRLPIRWGLVSPVKGVKRNFLRGVLSRKGGEF